MRRVALLFLTTLFSSWPALRGQGNETLALSFTTELPREMSIGYDVKALTESVSSFDRLIEQLGTSNDGLVSAMRHYLENPSDQVAASQVELELAKHAETLVREFDQVAAERDGIEFHFKLIERKLQRTAEIIGERVDVLDAKVAEFDAASVRMELELTDLAVQIRDGEQRGEDVSELRRHFASLGKKLKRNQRDRERYDRFGSNYRDMVANVSELSKTFSDLSLACTDMLDNLSFEKKILLDQIKYQRELIEVRRLVRDSLVSGQMALEKVANTVIQLYFKVDAFTEIHAKISEQMVKVHVDDSPLDMAKESLEKLEEAATHTEDDDLDALIERYANMGSEEQPDP